MTILQATQTKASSGALRSPNLDDGSIERADLDGKNRRAIVSLGATHTLTQLHLDKKSGKLYSSDREGMRVMCANLDGSQVKPLARSVRCACAPCAEPRATCSV
jgi:hypothetical protein